MALRTACATWCRNGMPKRKQCWRWGKTSFTRGRSSRRTSRRVGRSMRFGATANGDRDAGLNGTIHAALIEQRRACGLTLIVLIPLGFLLDLIFGRTFLRFPNLKATLGILIPGYDLGSGGSGFWGSGWKPFLPVEEFAFYALGFVAILLTYVWGDEILFRANKVDDAQRTPRVFRGWKATLLFWLTVGAVLF